MKKIHGLDLFHMYWGASPLVENNKSIAYTILPNTYQFSYARTSYTLHALSFVIL